MKEHKNISDELLIAYIEGNLNDEEAMIIEGYIDSDSRIFSRYAILNRSLRQIEETELEVTPDSLKDKLNNELNLEQDKAVSGKSISGEDFSILKLLDRFFKPAPILGTALSIFLLVFLIKVQNDNSKNALETNNSVTFPKKDKSSTKHPSADVDDKYKDLFSILKHNKVIPLKDSQKGIQVKYKNNTLIISQVLPIEREIYVINDSQTQMENFSITKKNNQVMISEKIVGDSIRVIMETEDVVVFDAWLIME